MKKVNAVMPGYQDGLGDVVFNFPDDFDWPVEAVIREAVRVAKGSAEVTVPRYGVVTLSQTGSRFKYTFTPDARYAKVKGLDNELKGVW